VTSRVGCVVVAKAPIPGFAKTRLAAEIGERAAAELAAAALLDTLDTVVSWTACSDRLLMVTGEFGAACRGAEIARALMRRWRVVEQSGETFGARLVDAHRVAAREFGPRAVIVQIGMDTPSLTVDELAGLASCVSGNSRCADVALGPADDGGWWGLATRRAGYVDGLVGVPMSTDETCLRTAAALSAAGARVAFGAWASDVDTLDDARRAASHAPANRFGSAYRTFVEATA
jgi:uncharacterized protein